MDPNELITSDAELSSLFAEIAERRLRFTRNYLRGSPLDTVLARLNEGDSPADWDAAGVPGELKRLAGLGFAGKRLQLVIAHPDLIAESPGNLFYYRYLLQMSGKMFPRVFGRLAGLAASTGPVELAPEDIDELQRMNRALTEMAISSGLSPEEARRTVIRSEGAAVDGDWRNQTGRIALWRTLEAIEASLDDQPDLEVWVKRAGKGLREVRALDPTSRATLEDEGWKPERVSAHRFNVVFGSQRLDGQTVDADLTISLLDASGSPREIPAVGEVKGSTDPANAKERWRLASGNIIAMNRLRVGRRNARPSTFYVGNVITAGVVTGDAQIRGMRALLEDGTLDDAFSVVKLTPGSSETARFREFLRAQIGV